MVKAYDHSVLHTTTETDKAVQHNKIRELAMDIEALRSKAQRVKVEWAKAEERCLQLRINKALAALQAPGVKP